MCLKRVCWRVSRCQISGPSLPAHRIRLPLAEWGNLAQYRGKCNTTSRRPVRMPFLLPPRTTQHPATGLAPFPERRCQAGLAHSGRIRWRPSDNPGSNTMCLACTCDAGRTPEIRHSHKCITVLQCTKGMSIVMGGAIGVALENITHSQSWPMLPAIQARKSTSNTFGIGEFPTS